MKRDFEKLKVMPEPPMLAFTNFKKAFIVETDASAEAVSGVLSQKGDDRKVHSNQLASRTMSAAERGLTAFEREALAVIFALRKFRFYLPLSVPIHFLTDHRRSKAAFARKDVHGRLARWLDFLPEYDCTLELSQENQKQGGELPFSYSAWGYYPRRC